MKKLKINSQIKEMSKDQMRGIKGGECTETAYICYCNNGNYWVFWGCYWEMAHDIARWCPTFSPTEPIECIEN